MPLLVLQYLVHQTDVLLQVMDLPVDVKTNLGLRQRCPPHRPLRTRAPQVNSVLINESLVWNYLRVFPIFHSAN